MEREQTRTEGRNSRIGLYDSKDIGNIINTQVAGDIKYEADGKKLGAKVNLYGRDGQLISEYRNKGKEARLAAIPFNVNDFENEIIRNIFRAGFVENGNRLLIGMADQLTKEQLEAYGKNDYISGILPHEIPETLKANAAYIRGYNMASITEERPVKKGR